MDKNKLLNNRQNTNIIVNTVSGYCAKCLRELSGDSKDIVKDAEGNWFCCAECRLEYWQEIRREMDCQYREWRNGGR